MNLRNEVVENLKKYSVAFTLLNGKQPCLNDWPDKSYEGEITNEQNFGIICGYGNSKFFVVDVDEFSLLSYFKKFLQLTYVVQTGRGFHIYGIAKNTMPKNMSLRNSFNQGIDILASRKVAVAETCDHYNRDKDGNYQKTGKTYTKISETRNIAEFDFEEDFMPILCDLGFIIDKNPAKERKTAFESGLKKGFRNNGLFNIARRAFQDGVDFQTVSEHLNLINAKSEEPLSQKDLDAIIKSAPKYISDNPRTNHDIENRLFQFANENIKKKIISSDDNSKIYGLIEINGHIESIDLSSTKAISWLRSKYFEINRIAPTVTKVEEVLTLICDLSSFDNSIKPTKINLRAAGNSSAIYYDLCGPDWKLVKITSNKTEIVDHGLETPVFERFTNESQQILPNLEYKENPIKEVCKLLQFGNESLFPIHFVSMFIPHIASPIMLIVGEQDSGKSSRTAIVKFTIDPRLTSFGNIDLDSQLNNFPKNDDYLNINLANNYCAAFDNVSDISQDQSDSLCKAITGAAYAKRKHYKDREEITLVFRRKIILNGIPVKAEQGDLARRTIYYQTFRIKKQSLDKILAKFQELLPDLLGQIFDVLSKAIPLIEKIRNEIKEPQHMADFTIWGEAISRVLGEEPMSFVDNYHERMLYDEQKLDEDNPAVSFFEEFYKNKIPNASNEVIISAGQCYDELVLFADKHHYDKKNELFPKSAGKIRGWLSRSTVLLFRVGIDIKISKYTKGEDYPHNTTILTITKIKSDKNQTTLGGVAN